MTKIDLITGFLGSGKTTFLKKYVRYLIDKGQKVCILEFDYGAVNVDMMLLQEFNSLCDLEMVAGGCDYDCHLRRFKTKLIAMGMRHYDRVIIEPSGIFDPDEFFDTLYEDPLDQWYEIGSVISVVDAGIRNLSEESEYILMAQLAASGKIVLSKTQNHSPEEVGKTVDYIGDILKKYNVPLDRTILLSKNFADFDSSDYQSFEHCSFRNYPHEKKNVIEANAYESVYFLNPGLSREKISADAGLLFGNESYGKIIRIKGFVHDSGRWYEFNKTKNEENLSEVAEGQDVLIVIGENLKQDKIKSVIDQK